jgi:hypothetical protein
MVLRVTPPDITTFSGANAISSLPPPRTQVPVVSKPSDYLAEYAFFGQGRTAENPAKTKIFIVPGRIDLPRTRRGGDCLVSMAM